MESQEQRLIDGLFSRLKQAEAQSPSRDANAGRAIAQQRQAQLGLVLPALNGQ